MFKIFKVSILLYGYSDFGFIVFYRNKKLFIVNIYELVYFNKNFFFWVFS